MTNFGYTNYFYLFHRFKYSMKANIRLFILILYYKYNIKIW